MAHITYDLMWREAMMELLDQLEAENPEDPALAPRDFSDWACVYIKYLQIFKRLEHAYDQMVHPQKRIDMLRTLEACMGRMLEVKHWIVALNNGADLLHLDDILVDLKLVPQSMQVPVPRYFRLDRQRELETREIFLEQLVKNFKPKRVEDSNSLSSGPPMEAADAVMVLQRSERGRQARAAAALRLITKKQRQLAEKRHRAGVTVTAEMAAVRLQSAIRGMLRRRQVRMEADEELVFLGMKPKKVDPEKDPQLLDARNGARRKLQQTENSRELESDYEALKARVREVEGPDMREVIQDKINQWFVESRNPETGDYPDFPEVEDGGSKLILNPPPPPLDDEEPPDPKAAKQKKPEKGGKGGKDDAKGKGGKAAADAAAGAGADGGESAVIASAFVPLIEDSIQEYVAKWQERDESLNFAQKYEPELVKNDLRPLVFEEIRVGVDEEMRELVANLKEMVEAERAARTGKKGKKEEKG